MSLVLSAFIGVYRRPFFFLSFVISATCFAQSQAETAIRHGEYANAEQILNNTIAQIEAKSGHNAMALDKPLELLARTFQEEKRYADAVTATERRVDVWTAAFGEDAVIVGRVLWQLELADKQALNFAGAEAAARRALAILTAAFVDEPPAAQAVIDLADVLLAEDRPEDAEQMLAVAQNMFEASFGPRSALAIEVATRRAAILKQPAPEPSGIESIGGLLTAPRVTKRVGPEYAEEARQKKLEGTVVLRLVIDATGTPTQIAVLRPLGLGLDEEAVKAVSQWKFSPGVKQGETPVPVQMSVEVTFHML